MLNLNFNSFYSRNCLQLTALLFSLAVDSIFTTQNLVLLIFYNQNQSKIQEIPMDSRIVISQDQYQILLILLGSKLF